MGTGESALDRHHHLLFRALGSEAFQRRLQTRIIGRRLYAFRTIGSTNDFARRLGRNREPEGSVVVAERQTRGRGRQGRVWYSPPGLGLWFSLLLRPPIESAEVGVIPLFAGVCVAEAAEEFLGIDAKLKWPNDVLVDQKKFCGILGEAEYRHDRLDFVVLGIGINVNHTETDLPPEVRDRATSLRLHLGRPVDRLEFLRILLQVLDQNYLRARSDGFSLFLEAWKGRCPYLGKPVLLHLDEGTYAGIFHDVAADGSLLLQTEEGVRAFSAGEITLRSS